MASYELESVNLEVNIAADSNISANITDAQSLSVTLGKAAELNVGQAVTYIESGKAEVQASVVEGIAEIQEAAENMANKDLNNLSAIGEGRFSEKQDIINDLNAIRSGAAAGTTAVQPSSLATVATSGSYNDLSNKPNLSVYALDNAVVHLSGNETVSGNKTFTGFTTFNENPYITREATRLYLRSAGITKGTAPSTSVWNGLVIQDSTGNYLGYIRHGYTTNKDSYIELVAQKANASSDTETTKLVLAYPHTGNPYATAPTPTDTNTQNGTQIATTGWVNSVGNNVVHLTDNETVSGNKTFTGFTTFNENPYITREATRLYLRSAGITKGTAPSTPIWNGLVIQDSTGNNLGYIRHGYTTNKDSYIELIAQKANALSDSASASIAVYYPASGSSYAETSVYFRPRWDNSLNLGDSSHRWKQLYAGTTTISTSDERLKQDIENISDEILDIWGEVEFYRYKFKDAVAEKGKNARYHTGLIAQRIERIFAEHGLNAFDYGLLCYDEWQEQKEEKDEEGNIITPKIKAGNRYSLRYEECLCLEAAYQRYRADKIEARLTALEARL